MHSFPWYVLYTQHNNRRRKSRKIYLSLYLIGLCVRGSLRPNRTTTYWLPLLWPSLFLSRSPGLLNRGPEAGFLYRILFLTRLIPSCSIGGLGPTLLGAGFLYRILSPTGLVSRLPDFLSSLSCIIVRRPPSSCGRHNFALIQPVHGQGYNILIIPRPGAPVIYIGAFPILTARPGRRLIYNISIQKKSTPKPEVKKKDISTYLDTCH